MALVDVRALRKHRGLSQATLAQAIGLSQKRVSAMELQPGTVTVAQLGRILDVLGYAMQLHAVEGWKPGDEVDSSATSSVYVLPHRELPVIKIGKANDVVLRAGLLEGVDLEKGCQLLVESDAAAFNLESVLHRAFRSWRLSAYDAAKWGVGDSGATEWFRAECTEKVMRFLAANAEILGFRTMPVLPAGQSGTAMK